MDRRTPRVLRSTLAGVLVAALCPSANGAPPVPAAPAAAISSSLDVRVSDAAGKPLAGALVLAVPVAGGARPGGVERVPSALTGADGRATLNTLPPGPWTVSVQARGHAVTRLPRVAAGPLVVRLERGGLITGTVRAADGGRPIAGARVRLGEGRPLPEAWQVEATRVEAVTDARGRFRLEGVGRAARVTARALGFGVAARDDVRPGEAVDLFLFPGSTLTGTVRDDAGRPVAGALVRADGDGPRATSQAETTDASGAFEMAGIRPGEYVVVARAGARAPGIASVLVAPEAEASVALVLSDGGFATGQVVDPEGRPLAGRVRLEVFEQRGLSASTSDAIGVAAGSDGRFALGPLPLGALGLGVSAARHAARRVELTIPARGRTVDVGAVTLEAGPSLRGQVRDAEGNAIPGARVDARTQGRAERSQGEAVAEGDGSFLIAGLVAAPHQVTASAAGYAAARVRATPGAPPLELVLARGGEIAGRVVDAQGAPVEDAEVEGQPVDEPPFTPNRVSGSSDEGEGRFTLRDVAAGRYVLQVRASGRSEATVSDVRVAAGRTTDLGAITLGRGGTVVGSVVDPEGAGIPGADVHLEKDLSMQTGRHATQTGASGAFELRGVAPGRINVLVRHPAFAAAKPVVAEVDPEKEPQPVRVVLSRGARLEGRALRRDGTPFTGGRVTISNFELGPAMGWEPAAIGADGSFSVEHVAAGPATVNLMAFAPSGPPGGPGGSALTSVAAQDAELREGETTTVSFALRDVIVAGRVTRADQPVPGVHVSLMPFEGAGGMSWGGGATRAPVPLAGPPPLAATTRGDGSFELVVFHPGRYRADITSLSSGQRHPGRTLDLPDVDRYELDLQIADTSASGVVVDRETGQPLAETRVALIPLGREGRAPGSTTTGADGAFTVAVEPGDYSLTARAPKHKPASLRVAVGPGGAGDLRVELERGLTIAGRVVDEAGRPQGEVDVTATRVDRSAALARSRPDGRFDVEGLEDGSYTLAAGTGTGGFAVRSGVTPGGEPVALVLRPGGKVAVRVLDAAGRPVKEAWPEVFSWSGAPVELPYTGASPTDASGACELRAPAGRLELRVFSERGSGSALVSVRADAMVPVEIRLQETAKP